MHDWNKYLENQPVGEPKTIGQLLRKMRTESGCSQTEMGKKVGLTRWTIGEIEKDVPESIAALDAIVIRKWKTACKFKMALNTLKTYSYVMTKFFKID